MDDLEKKYLKLKKAMLIQMHNDLDNVGEKELYTLCMIAEDLAKKQKLVSNEQNYTLPNFDSSRYSQFLARKFVIETFIGRIILTKADKYILDYFFPGDFPIGTINKNDVIRPTWASYEKEFTFTERYCPDSLYPNPVREEKKTKRVKSKRTLKQVDL